MDSLCERHASFLIPEAACRVSCIVTSPPKPNAVIVLAHGAGAGIQHPFMKQIAEELYAQRMVTIRYNFPFMENKKRRPDGPVVAMAAVRSAIDFAITQFPEKPLFASGKSFGGRMSSQFIAHYGGGNIKGVVFLGFPLHPAGKPGTDRAAHLQQVNLPMLFLHGTKDTLAEIGLMEQVCNDLQRATLIQFQGADHSFNAPKQDLIPNLAASIASWTHTILT
ncbi:MAG: alpha/beta family hydrolase [Cyclobacteriaceae bacterium]